MECQWVSGANSSQQIWRKAWIYRVVWWRNLTKGRFPAWGLDVWFMTLYHRSSLCNYLVAVSRLMTLIVGEWRWLWSVSGMTIDGESKILTYSVSQCHFFYRRSHIDCPGLKPLVQKSMFYIKAVPVGFVVDKVVLGHVLVIVCVFLCKLLSHQCCILMCIFIYLLSVVHSLRALLSSVTHATTEKNVQELFVYLPHSSLII